ncbi:MAG: hypothetical protein QNK05_00980 [Myxococcota bacterium]|nr:hypothetical protein [Myxococcota bacterium]
MPPWLRPPGAPPGRPRHAARFAPVLLALLGLTPALGVPAQASTPACTAWPGEVSPLPTDQDPDRLRAAWATLRYDELSRVATGLEGLEPLEAHRLWRHARCLRPDSVEANEGVERTRPRAVHRPSLRARDAEEGPSRVGGSSFAFALQQVSVRLIAAEPPTAQPGPRALARRESQQGTQQSTALRPAADNLRALPARSPCGTLRTPCQELDALTIELAGLEALLRGARFREALDGVQALDLRMEALDASEPSRELRVRTEVLRATAEVALGNTAQARDAFSRALVEEPGLALDPMTVSPKVRRALEEARRSGADG